MLLCTNRTEITRFPTDACVNVLKAGPKQTSLMGERFSSVTKFEVRLRERVENTNSREAIHIVMIKANKYACCRRILTFDVLITLL